MTDAGDILSTGSHPGGSGGGTEVAPGVTAPADALRVQFSRSGGPGGQNVNKLNTKAELWVRVDALAGLSYNARARLRHDAGRRMTAAGELHLVSESERGQEGNRAAVMDRLREMIVRAKVEPKVRRKSKPSRSQKAKRLDQKKRRGEIKSKRRFRAE
ncbi:MAG TPA: alternative ribosome rescue aminoacyl-tRNA hydrolase ArfB [Tepidisphaeraceae bacterium]|nr:alternative ribosome rescue aminoacyl-tRNA hydrolase ArfB [Tepidisphaeraceae bacterium]